MGRAAPPWRPGAQTGRRTGHHTRTHIHNPSTALPVAAVGP